MGTRGNEGLFGEGMLASRPDGLTAEELRRTLHHLQIETQALREALERTARHAHDADPSTSHVADFERCPHPVCRQARAMLPAGRAEPEPEDIRRFGTVDRRPRARAGEDPADLEGLGGAADTTGFERSDEDDEVEPSWIPLDRAPEPPQRRPAPRPAERADPSMDVVEPARTTVEPPSREAPTPAGEPPERPVAEPVTPAAEDDETEDEPAVAEAEEAPPRPWITPMPPEPARVDEPPIPSHLFDAPPRLEPARPSGVLPSPEHTADGPQEPAIEGDSADPDRPSVPRHVPPDKDAGIADAAADAIDRLARALFGPKRRRY